MHEGEGKAELNLSGIDISAPSGVFTYEDISVEAKQMDVLLFPYLKLSVQGQYKEVLLQAATFLEGVTLLQDKRKGTNLINKSNAISELFSLECKDGNTAKFSTDANKAIRKYYQAKATGEDMIMYVLTNAFRGPEYEST